MFENFDRPISSEEYNRAFESALLKINRLIEQKGKNAADRYNIEYFKLLLREQLLQERYYNESVRAYKKGTLRRMHPRTQHYNGFCRICQTIKKREQKCKDVLN